MNTEPDDNPEGRLCGHLAAALANRCLDHYNLGRKPFERFVASIVGHGVHDIDMVAFGKVEEALASVGILVLTPHANGCSYWLFAHDVDEMPDFLARTMSAGDPRAKAVIRAFVQLAGQFDPTLPWWNPPYTNPWFEPPALYRDAMDWLHRTDFAKRDGDRFQWTEKISFAMADEY